MQVRHLYTFTDDNNKLELKGDDKLIYEGLSIYGITYRYGKICAKYSPTQKDENIGQFDFYFNSANEYTSDMLESVAMQIYVLHGEIVKVDGYEV